MTMGRILIADDEPGIREFLGDVLSEAGHEVVLCADGAEAAARLDERRFDLVLTDLQMPGLGGLELLEKVRGEQPEVEVIVLTAHGTVDTAVQAMKLGAFEFLQKPVASPDEVAVLVERALERRRLVAAAARAERDAPARPNGLSHGDPAMVPVVEAIEKVARANATVLLLGESGTGKEVAARTIHELSPRQAGPFMAINCAALAETLLESELFGHEKGAFTGATERRQGRLELADGGTFFLDEVGELKQELQAKLLRVLQERKFERVGGSRSIDVDVRWIAATNRDLRAMMEAGTFREDLYHRLAVFPIRLPPLRQRPADLLPIAQTLLQRVAREANRKPLSLTPAAQQKLAAWSWPGNVRELANTLERAAILADGSLLDAEHIVIDSDPGRAPADPDAVKPLAVLEREAIDRALASVGGNRRKAAELLGIGERTLYDKLRGQALPPKGK
jgi:two-component system, NtrC family, response regulator AtoC